MIRRGLVPAERALAAVLLLPSIALAEDPLTVPSLGDAALRTVAALGAVLALIALLAYLFRRFRETASVRPGGSGIVSRSRLDLGNRREIRVVEVDGRRLVVGVTGERIDLLLELTEGSDDSAIDVPSVESLASPLARLRKLATS